MKTNKELVADGTNLFVFSVKDGGMEIVISGWSSSIRNLPIGTKLLISTDNGKTGSPYKIISSSIPNKPKDQYFHTCKFDPTKDQEITKNKVVAKRYKEKEL